MRRIAASSVAPIAQLSALPASLRCTRLSRPLDERHSGSTSLVELVDDERHREAERRHDADELAAVLR
jgi:hypothetical protein